MTHIPGGATGVDGELSAQTGFAGNDLDRLSDRREDVAFLAQLHDDPTTRVILLCDGAVLFRPAEREALFSLEQARALGAVGDLLLLGRNRNGAVFVAEIGADPASPSALLQDVRAIARQGLVEEALLGALAQARSLTLWRARHRFCANCGGPTASAAAGWRRDCERCGAQHFPRVDPVVIMLVADGDFCLLARQARFAPGMYSALAGYMEPGETIENAVRREVREETAVRVGRVVYLASQPWPFPSSLMIGCLAEALSRDIRLDTTELEDARWFARAEARAMLSQTHPEGLRAPDPVAIARRLLEAWLSE